MKDERDAKRLVYAIDRHTADGADIDPDEPALLDGVLRKNDEVGKILHKGTYTSCIEYARSINWTQFYSLTIVKPSGIIIQRLVCPDRMAKEEERE